MTTIVGVLKLNQIYTVKTDPLVESKLINIIKYKITPQTVAMYYQLAKCLSLSNLSEVAITYIRRWFTTVADTNNFLELEFSLVNKILLDSGLHLTSEIEVFSAADVWISHNFKDRTGYSKDLLSTIRFPLLSDHVLKYLLQKPSSFQVDKKCLAVLKRILREKGSYFQYLPSSHFTTRYCSQTNFNILCCKRLSINEIDGRNLKSAKRIPSLMTKNRRFSKLSSSVVYLKGHVYYFNCLYRCGVYINKVEKYSIATDSIDVVADMFDDRISFCACGFLDKVYIVGGKLNNVATATCILFDTKEYKWENAVIMNEARLAAACTVFEGAVVVSGGYHDGTYLRTVEAYDHIADEWSYMPNMIEEGCYHKLVAIKNKLFAMGGWKKLVEVYDSTCKKFVIIRPTILGNCIPGAQAISLANKVVIFFCNRSSVLCYDVDTDEWNVYPCGKGRNINDNIYIKVPKLFYI